ncbi:HTTM domain-containing protein [Microbacterium sp. CIAB417]|uniref:HTTM domain-containing protein n=1 Tax=Microbacterium sp. CIAB417 TaxID=2860287 RepID=UPI001FACB13F|nr:HTTM domain-containing protein [Microbacterium sp. CIAB417]
MSLNERFDGWLRWLTATQHNLRSFSILRIIFGAGLLLTLVPSIPDRSYLWGPASFWVDPEARRRGYITFDVLISKSDPVLFDVAFFALVALVLLFTVGFATRFVTPVMLIMLVSLQSNNPYVLNGGDTLYRITLLFLVFANLSAHFSVDAWLASRRREPAGGRRTLAPGHVVNSAHNAALILCCFQIIVVYVVSGIWKLTGDDWPAGTALFYSLRIDAFMAYPAFNELLWQSSLLIYVATFIALWAQTLFPLALLWRPSRIAVLLTLMFMHLGIAVLLGLWPFSLAMIALDMLFIRDSSWVRLDGWMRSRLMRWRGRRRATKTNTAASVPIS